MLMSIETTEPYSPAITHATKHTEEEKEHLYFLSKGIALACHHM